MIRVFFSYSRADSATVNAIRRSIAAPLSVWIDHQAIDAGQWFPERIEAAIKRECHFFAVFLSPSSAASEWVAEEVRWALEREAMMRSALPAALRTEIPFVIPLALQSGLDPSLIPPSLRQHNVFVPKDAVSPVAEVCEKLTASAFQYAARYLANYQPTFETAVVDSLRADLAVLQDRAFRISACLRDPVEILATDPACEKELTEAILSYNETAVPLVRRLPEYAQTIRATWGANLGDESDRLSRFVQESIYRGQVYALNKVTASVAEAKSNRLTAAELAEANQAKTVLLAEVQRSLGSLKTRCGRLVERLRKEAR